MLPNPLTRIGEDLDVGPVTLRCQHGGEHFALTPAQTRSLAQASERRVRSFRAGRAVAAALLAGRGFEDWELLNDDERVPVWPPSLVGSISHRDELAVCAVGNRADIAGIGVDIETRHEVKAELARQICSRWDDPATDLALVFSAKEAAYKAVFPRARHFIDFSEASVHVDDTGTLAVRYHGEHRESRIMNDGRGRFWLDSRHVLTLFTLPLEGAGATS